MGSLVGKSNKQRCMLREEQKELCRCAARVIQVQFSFFKKRGKKRIAEKDGAPMSGDGERRKRKIAEPRKEKFWEG